VCLLSASELRLPNLSHSRTAFSPSSALFRALSITRNRYDAPLFCADRDLARDTLESVTQFVTDVVTLLLSFDPISQKNIWKASQPVRSVYAHGEVGT